MTSIAPRAATPADLFAPRDYCSDRAFRIAYRDVSGTVRFSTTWAADEATARADFEMRAAGTAPVLGCLPAESVQVPA